MTQYMNVHDISMTDDFSYDFDRAPDKIKKRINTLIEMILVSNRFPTSMHVRKAFKDELWMGNVTQNSQAWRVVFWIDESKHTIILHRLLTHDQRDEYLRI